MLIEFHDHASRHQRVAVVGLHLQRQHAAYSEGGIGAIELIEFGAHLSEGLAANAWLSAECPLACDLRPCCPGREKQSS